MGAISDLPINAAFFALKSAVLSKLNKLISNEDLAIVASAYTFQSSDIYKTKHLSSGGTITVPLSAIADGAWCNFINTDGLTYTFAVSGGLSIKSESSKVNSDTQNTAVTILRKGTNLYLIGKLSA